MIDRTREVTLMKEEFDYIWTTANQYENQQNLLCEVLARGDVVLEDWTFLFYPIADIGTRVFLYYMGLEQQMEQQRQIDLVEQSMRQVAIQDYRRQIDEALEDQSVNLLVWKAELQRLRDMIKTAGEETSPRIEALLSNVLSRETVGQ